MQADDERRHSFRRSGAALPRYRMRFRAISPDLNEAYRAISLTTGCRRNVLECEYEKKYQALINQRHCFERLPVVQARIASRTEQSGQEGSHGDVADRRPVWSATRVN